MTREETAKILSVIRVAYPRAYAHLSEEDISTMINLWHRHFENDDYALVAAATTAYIDSNTTGFEPNIGQIKEKMRLISAPERMDANAAWQIILKAANDAYYAPVPAFNSLPPLLQKFVGDWKNLIDIYNADTTTLSVMKSDFMKQYNAHYERADELASLPESARQYRAALLSRNNDDENGLLGE